MGKPFHCPVCGEVEFIDSNYEISCRSCNYTGNPQIVFPLCPVCKKASLKYDNNKVICKFKECGYSGTSEKASTDCVSNLLGDNGNSKTDRLVNKAIWCPDCSGEAVHDFDNETVYCYSCGGGWTNKQFQECESCGYIKLTEEMTDGVCLDCYDCDNDDDE